MKQAIAIIVVTAAIVGGIYYYLNNTSEPEVTEPMEVTIMTEDEQTTGTSTATTTDEQGADTNDESKTVLGTSVEGRDIVAYHYGDGETELMFVGGIHGGYSWNTALVANQLVDYLDSDPTVVPNNIKVTVIPVMNPDGLNSIVGSPDRFSKVDVPTDIDETIPGRFNANEVDLNRNFDCEWEATGTWKDIEVSGGTEAFSEPESKAIREYVTSNDIRAVVVWYSSAGGVFASSCNNGVLDETKRITNAYADASGYKAFETFDFYEITGDMVNWLAGQEIPAISVLLSDHESVEWEENKKGIEAILDQYRQ